MGDSAAHPVTSTAPMISPISASPTDSEGSSDEATMLWAQYSAPDECSSNEFQLYSRLPSPPASHPTDLLSLWLSKYMSASPDALVKPPRDDVLVFVNTDLDDTDLGVWDPTSVIIPNTPEPTLSWFVPSPWPAPGVFLSPCSPPESKCPAGALNSSSSTSTMPALPSSATQIPVPECGEGIVLTTPPAMRELFHPDSATASTQDNHYSLNTNVSTTHSFGLPGHQFMPATQNSTTSLAQNANSVAAVIDRILGRRHQSAPISSWSADPSGQQTMIPQRRLSWESSQLLPPVVVAAAPMPVARPPLLTSLGSPPSWSPGAPEPPATLSFQTGESSKVNSSSDILFWWNRDPSCIMRGDVFAPKPPKELMPKRVTRCATLKRNKNQKASLGTSSVANLKLRNTQQRRKRMNESLKTLQKLVIGDRKVDLVTLLEMTCNSIIITEYQIEAQKVR